MNNTAILTIVSNNYLHFARTLLKSVKLNHPEADLFCAIVDDDLTHAQALSDEFNVIKLDDLNIENLEQFIFQYTVLELNTAVKPWAMEHLLTKGYSKVMYIDPDIQLYQPLNEVVQALNTNSDIVVTPHLTAPMTDDLFPTELNIRVAGTYNFGFCAVKNTTNTLNFIKWWQSKLYRGCIVDIERGIFVDQSWIDLVPGLFDNVFILKHPGYNVAYWNLAQRAITFNKESNLWMSQDHPLVFFHYSGLNPLKPNNFSKHQNRFKLKDLGELKKLAEGYINDLLENGAKQYSTLTYGFSKFSNNENIPNGLRKLYLKDEALRKQLTNNPFECGNILSQTIPKKYNTTQKVTWAMYLVWSLREDLQKAFDLSNKNSAYDYWNWFLTEGENYYSEKVINEHFTAFQNINKPINTDKTNKILLQPIFFQILGRDPGPRAVEKLSKLCNSKLTSILCAFIIGASKESRHKKYLLKRMSGAIKYILNPAVGSTFNNLSNLGSPTRDLKKLSVSANLFSGIHFSDQDIEQNGLWCDHTISVPLPDGRLNSIELSGSFPFDLHKVKSATLSLYLNDTLIESFPLSDNNLTLTKSWAKEDFVGKNLTIKADSFFRPSEINLGNDDRTLSFRIKQLKVNGVNLINYMKPPFTIDRKSLYQTFGVNLIGYLAADLGVGEAARSMAKCFADSNIKYSITDVGYQSPNSQSNKSAFKKATKAVYDIDLVYVNADQVENTLNHIYQNDHPTDTYKIGYWHWEQPQLPEKFLSSFNHLNEVWVPSGFIHQAVASISSLPVFKVPHAIEFNIEKVLDKTAFGIPEKNFAVLVMYDFHSYRFRKNPEAAIEAFKIAAKDNQNITLVIKTMNAAEYADEYQMLKDSVTSLASVVFIDEALSHDKRHALQNACDCLLSLHRAEGFGFALAEMMYLGKPVIATGWSGNMEFMNHMNSMLVNYELKALENNVGVYEAGQVWAEADVEHAAHCLHKLINSHTTYEKIGKIGQSSILSNYNTRVIGDIYKNRFSLIKSNLI